MCQEESREQADEGCAACQRGHLPTPAGLRAPESWREGTHTLMAAAVE